MNKLRSFPDRLFRFYYDGFRGLSSWGKRAWLVIIIKLFIIFAVLKIFFFPDLLKRNFTSDTERSNYIRNQIINPEQK